MTISATDSDRAVGLQRVGRGRAHISTQKTDLPFRDACSLGKKKKRESLAKSRQTSLFWNLSPGEFSDCLMVDSFAQLEATSPLRLPGRRQARLEISSDVETEACHMSCFSTSSGNLRPFPTLNSRNRELGGQSWVDRAT